MKYLMIAAFALLSIAVNAQGDPLVYSRVLTLDSVSKSDLFDKALIWCSKSFNDSKSAINVKEKESGIIAGKATIDSYYKIPRRKDSVSSTAYTNYLFDWLIEVKESKVRFSLKNIIVKEYGGDYPVTINGRYPIKFAFLSEEKNKQVWDLAKAAFVRNIDALTNSLYSDLNKRDNW